MALFAVALVCFLPCFFRAEWAAARSSVEPASPESEASALASDSDSDPASNSPWSLEGPAAGSQYINLEARLPLSDRETRTLIINWRLSINPLKSKPPNLKSRQPHVFPRFHDGIYPIVAIPLDRPQLRFISTNHPNRLAGIAAGLERQISARKSLVAGLRCGTKVLGVDFGPFEVTPAGTSVGETEAFVNVILVASRHGDGVSTSGTSAKDPTNGGLWWYLLTPAARHRVAVWSRMEDNDEPGGHH